MLPQSFTRSSSRSVLSTPDRLITTEYHSPASLNTSSPSQSPEESYIPSGSSLRTPTLRSCCATSPDESYSFSSSSSDSPSLPSTVRSLHDFDILKLLGIGGTGRVYLARDKLTFKLVALKIISKKNRDQDQLDDVANEQLVHHYISDRVDNYILPLLGSWHDNLNFFIITEYIPGSDLAVELMKSRKLEEDRVRFYAAELILALESLHKRNVMHRDVKPGNVLLDADGHIRLCDFGSAKAFTEPTSWREKRDSVPGYKSFDANSLHGSDALLKSSAVPIYSSSDVCGTPYFMSPEQHEGREYSFNVDYWELGVMIFRMLTGRMPFGDDVQHTNDIKYCVLNDPLVFRPTDDISPVTRTLLQGLLAKLPRNRLSIKEIKSHAYFQNVDWDKLARREVPCPYKPYIAPVPKHAKPVPPTIPGVLYLRAEDPYPLFHFMSAEMDRPLEIVPSPPMEYPHSKLILFMKVAKILNSLLGKPSAPEARENTPSPTLRPLLLSPLATDRSLSPPSIVPENEKSGRSIGYKARSQDFQHRFSRSPSPNYYAPAKSSPLRSPPLFPSTSTSSSLQPSGTGLGLGLLPNMQHPSGSTEGGRSGKGDLIGIFKRILCCADVADLEEDWD